MSNNTDDRTNSTRRTFLQGIGVVGGMAAFGTTDALAVEADSGGDGSTYELPPLPYENDALEPHVDARIMELHHDEHHQGYVDGANEALTTLAEMREAGEFSDVKSVKRDLSFNLSGHVLHSLFWKNMSPDGGGSPPDEFADVLADAFGSVSAFREEFVAAATNVEGSGWGLLVYDHLADQLLVTQTELHNDLAVQAATPLLVLDVWEHAYYLQYENRRSEYVEAFWNVVNWDDVAERYSAVSECDLLDAANC